MNQHQGFLGKKHSEETLKKMSLKQSGSNHPMYGKKHKENSKMKASRSLKKWWNSEEGKKQRIMQSNKMKNGFSSYANSFNTSPSKPQVELFNLIKQLYPTCIMNYPFFNYSLDIAIPEYRIVIEYDSSYWHQDKEYDKRRQNYLENHSWKFIRYRDVIPSIEQIKNDILKENK